MSLGKFGLGGLFVIGRLLALRFRRLFLLRPRRERGGLPGRRWLGLGLLFIFAVGVPAVFDVFLIRSRSRLPVIIYAVLCGVSSLRLGRGLGLFPSDAFFFFGFFRRGLGLKPCPFGSLGERFLFVGLPEHVRQPNW